MQFKLPVKSSKLNAFILFLGIGSPFFGNLPARASDLSETQLQWIAQQIFQNECNRDVACLTSWNSGEDFPSLGLGHFIWYQPGQAEIYTETFPGLLQFYHSQGVETPTWITALPGPDSPWQNRAQFYQEFDQPRLAGLRQFLLATLPTQTRFILARQLAALPAILAQAPAGQRQALAALFQQVATASPPMDAMP